MQSSGCIIILAIHRVALWFFSLLTKSCKLSMFFSNTEGGINDILSTQITLQCKVSGRSSKSYRHHYFAYCISLQWAKAPMSVQQLVYDLIAGLLYIWKCKTVCQPFFKTVSFTAPLPDIAVIVIFTLQLVLTEKVNTSKLYIHYDKSVYMQPNGCESSCVSIVCMKTKFPSA